MKENIENISSSQTEENIFGLENKTKNLITRNKNIVSKEVKLVTLDELITSDHLKKKEKKFVYLGEGIGLLNEKKGLKRILKTIQDDLDIENETLEEVFEPYLNNEDMSKRVIKEGTGLSWLIFMFYIISPLFGVINLVAIFESLSMMRVLWQMLKNAIVVYFNSLGEEDDKITKFSVLDFNNKYNYFFMFFEDAKKDSFDFNLVMFTAFLGDLLLQSRGFRVSTAVFALMNAVSIFLVLSFSFLDYDKDDNKYTVLNILYLLLSYILLFLGVGASALLSQQIIIDSNVKYDDYSSYLKKLYEESKELSENLKDIREKIQVEKKNLELEKKDLTFQERQKKDIEIKGILLNKLEELLNEKEENNKNKYKNDNKNKKDSETIYLPMLGDMITSDRKEEEVKEEEVKQEEVKEEEVKENEEKKEEVKEEEENNNEISFPFKKFKSGYNINYTMKNANLDNIIGEKKDFPLLKDNDDENKNDMKNIKDSINQVDRRKLLLRKSKTLLVTKRDAFRERRTKQIKEQEKKKKKREEAKQRKKSKTDSFFMVCLTTIIGYFIKYLINTIIAENDDLKIDKYMHLTNCGDNITCFQNIINDTNLIITNKSLLENLNNSMYEDNMKYFYFIIIIYGACIISSILLYSFFICIFDKREKKPDKKENNLKNKYRVCEICGYIIYSQNLVLNPNPKCCECLTLLCETLLNCINMAFCTIIRCKCINCYNRGNDEQNEDKKDENNNNKIDIYQENEDDTRCHCCLEYKEDDYKKNKEFFCYCYQAQRQHYWLNKFLTNDVQRKLFPYMAEYFLLQILICAFEKHYNLNYQNYSYFDTNGNHFINDIYSFLTFILAFFLFFYFTLSFVTCIEMWTFNPKGKYKDLKYLSNGIFDGTHGILIFDGIFALIFSSLYLSNSDNFLFEKNIFFIIPILMNKFYYFTLMFYCLSYSEEKRKFELISSSTLISVYIFIINSIISLIRDSITLKVLYIIQLVFSCFPCILIPLILVYLIIMLFDFEYPCYMKVTYLFCLSSFLCCFGGFWMSLDFFDRFSVSINEDNMDCSLDTLSNCCYYCCSDCFSCCINSVYYRTIKSYTSCECCNCCICYDCCECCECFYCCGNECSCEYC